MSDEGQAFGIFVSQREKDEWMRQFSSKLNSIPPEHVEQLIYLRGSFLEMLDMVERELDRRHLDICGNSKKKSKR